MFKNLQSDISKILLSKLLNKRKKGKQALATLLKILKDTLEVDTFSIIIINISTITPLILMSYSVISLMNNKQLIYPITIFFLLEFDRHLRVLSFAVKLIMWHILLHTM